MPVVDSIIYCNILDILTFFMWRILFFQTIFIICALISSLSGCPRASLAKKKTKFPGEDYMGARFKASDGESSIFIYCAFQVSYSLYILICLFCF